MLGIVFVGHKVFHCLLKEYECQVYPLRRDFVLSGLGNSQSSDTVSFGGLFSSIQIPVVESNRRVS